MSQPINQVRVGLDFGRGIQPVGRLALRDRVIYFEYDSEFVEKGLEISPFRLPLQQGVVELPQRPFEGLAGVFSDSLPDGWGRLLFDRMVKSRGILPGNISLLDRLAHVGISGMGALVYEPDHSPSDDYGHIDLDHLALQAEQVLLGAAEEVIGELLALNGSSAGARPKALIAVGDDRKCISYGTREHTDGFEHWLVKFGNTQDGHDAGAIEYVYALMAKEAGVLMPDVHLFPSERGAGYFAVKRFDRSGHNRIHMHTASGLLHSDFRTPVLDYEDLLNLTAALTRDTREVERMYRLAVFNVFAHNRDDHAKNFSYLMDETGEWKLAPAYDLTFSSGPGAEQSTMVLGEGKNPGVSHLEKLGLEMKLSKKLIREIVEQTRDSLSRWEKLAREHEVENSNIRLIQLALNKRK